MAILNKGQTFSDGEQVTSAKLNTLVDGSTFASGAVDDVSTQLSGGAIIVKDGGITEQKLGDGSVATSKIADSNVTKEKIENVANMKVLGNTSGSSAAPQEVSILDEDNMVSNSNVSIPTQQSVKAYIDSLFSATAPSSDDYVLHSIANSGSISIGSISFKFGNFELHSDSNQSFTFPSAFSNDCLVLIITETRGSGLTGGRGLDVPYVSKSSTGFTLNRYDEQNGSQGLTFFAIGY
jgi:hypothetical protein